METEAGRTGPCLGKIICDREGWAFADVFRHQFRISRTPSIDSWPNRRLGPYWIEHCSDLPVTPIRNRRGQHIGWCLGVAIDGRGDPVGNGSRPVTVPAAFDNVEQYRARLAGRYALIVRIGGETRYYPDATSSLTAVMNRNAGVLASTVPLAVISEIEPTGDRARADIETKPYLYAMGETPDRRVQQLLGHHYVRLEDFSSHRFWPTDDTEFRSPLRDGDHVAAMAERLQAINSGFALHFDCVHPITGGMDSRLLAAALSEEARANIRSFFVYEINWVTGFDVAAAQQVADHIGVDLIVKRVLSGDCQAELSDLDIAGTRAQVALASGYMHPALVKPVLQSMHVSPAGKYLLRGGVAEMTRANKWPAPAAQPECVTSAFGFQRLIVHPPDVVRDQLGDATFDRYRHVYDTWFAALPEAARARAPDVAHGTFWLSGPVCSAFYAPRRHFFVNPFNEQWLMHQTMRFDPVMRKRGLLVRALLDHMCPGASDLPYTNQLRAEKKVA